MVTLSPYQTTTISSCLLTSSLLTDAFGATNTSLLQTMQQTLNSFLEDIYDSSTAGSSTSGSSSSSTSGGGSASNGAGSTTSNSQLVSSLLGSLIDTFT